MTTKTQAIDHLVDVLAGEDVNTGDTVAGAIDKLATMIEDGEITIGGDLPAASADTLGGVKVGSGLSITETGVLSASGGGGKRLVFIADTEDEMRPCEMQGADSWSEVEAAMASDDPFDAVLVIDGYLDGEPMNVALDAVGWNYGSFEFDVEVNGKKYRFRVENRENVDPETGTTTYYIGWSSWYEVKPLDIGFYEDDGSWRCTENIETVLTRIGEGRPVNARWLFDGSGYRDLALVEEDPKFQCVRVYGGELKVASFMCGYDPDHGGGIIVFDEESYPLNNL